ncbi:MAG: hypothetical protein EHM87_03625 [Burkholderiales bacterium]|nr:MAG: hypothetical protein EHM87_03625 [Burkholderiales bacterium]
MSVGLPPKSVSPHALGAVAVLIGLAWTLRTTLVGGPPLHWLVTPLALYVLGPRWAAVAALGGAGFAAAAGTITWSAMPMALLIDGWLPIAVAWGWLRLVEKRLPPHLFIYLFIAVFAGTLVATLAGGAAQRLLFSLGAGRETGVDWWIALLILADGEAVTTGIVVTGLAVYRPQWLQTFDADRYLGPPGPRRRG